MTPLRTPALAIAGLAALAACAAYWLARTDKQHRIVAYALAYSAIADAVREVIGATILRPERARLDAIGPGHPAYTGTVRGVFHLEQALLLGWYAVLAWLALAVFAKRNGPDVSTEAAGRGMTNAGTVNAANMALGAPAVNPVPAKAGAMAGLAWLVVTACCAVAYPQLSGWPEAPYRLQYAYACAAGAAAVAVLGAASLYRGAWQARHLCAVVLAGGLLGEIVTYAMGPWGGHWGPARVGWALVFGVVLGYNVRAVWKQRFAS
jgi:hypothetical protein